MSRKYSEEDFIRIAKRENNNKRSFLILNPLQGKHLPVRPKKAMEAFDALGQYIFKEVLKGEEVKNVLVIGFAETATAIGVEVSGCIEKLLNMNEDFGLHTVYYIHSTRETVKDANYLFFTEDHSHAIRQKLVVNGFEDALKLVSHIILIDDEISTGNTMKNLIGILKENYSLDDRKFIVASLINGMSPENAASFKEMNIPVVSIINKENDYEKLVASYKGEGEYIEKKEFTGEARYERVDGYLSTRRLVDIAEYKEGCVNLANEVMNYIHLEDGQRILVLGTEEFMYPALYTAYAIEKCQEYVNVSLDVKFHATTRSPICPGNEEDYPLKKRYELVSLKEARRKNFVYNLEKYDQCIVFTESGLKLNKGLESLLGALESAGNDDILVIKWKRKS
ncbi:TRSP domain C terminus to PRTase_2 [Acetitomaculum ruminis DSM 5522]|uniref:TRSP domain C terminus to PRTase_2 n=1 Tax=Acetitomaculum ruminis DSM 5522 TaxID=1120918 RepID=A0A1I0YBG7_9FIRM|nr:phosphoribosyltransferase domain-containing protein [Acetitomaculum ruminis]SFB10654.1 TRSP domain C terminus to PRTase_2 [Acetitomaculum ruminis DSM 5522]